MRRIWDKINEKNWSLQRKAASYISIQVILWTLLPAVLCLLAGSITGYNTQWVQESILIIGYSAVGIGFFGSTLYCMMK